MRVDVLCCPKCHNPQDNRQVVLGAITDDGFVIKRHSGAVTKIISNDYQVLCGICNEKVYFKQPEERSLDCGTIINYGIIRIHREQIISSGGTVSGTPSF